MASFSDPIAPIDEGMLSFYRTLNQQCPPESAAWPLPQQRRAWDDVCRAFRAPRPDGVEVREEWVTGPTDAVKVRIYRPHADGPLPGILYFHGGGWVLGSLETHDDMCAELASGSRSAVVALDYRLAPEHPHPAQLEDSLAALKWLRRRGQEFGIDPLRLLAAGDSAGGQMTAALCMWLRDKREPQLMAQLLIYPVLGSDIDTPSYLRNAEAPCLTREEMTFYLESFLGARGSANWSDKYAVPLLETDYRNLPPAFITAAAHDPLHDDAVIYAERLKAAGVKVELRREPELAHSYMRARHVSEPAREGFAAIVAAARAFTEQA
jgi:acetyl esterase